MVSGSWTLYGGSVATRSTEPAVHRRQDRQGVADDQSRARTDRSVSVSPGIGRAEVGQDRSAAIALGQQRRDQRLVDVRPALVELDADRPARTARDGRPQQRPADPGERIEDEIAGLA